MTGYSIRNCSSIFVLNVVIAFSAMAASEIKFAGVPISPGATVRADVPLTEQQKSYAAANGNIVPAKAVAVISVPPNFDPKKNWPVLLAFSTSDFHRQNRDDLVDIYRDTAIHEGWIVLAGDGPDYPRNDTTIWRAAMTLAALDAFYRSFPGSLKWPVVCAGYSGGAKRASQIAPMLPLAGCRITGLYLTGINEDHLSEGYRLYHPGSNFLNTPIFISSGKTDRVATPQQQYEVSLSLKRTGFRPVRLESFPEGHAVKRTHLREALRWFRSLQAGT